MGPFGAAHGWGGGEKVPLSEICHIYPTMMKHDTVILCLKKVKTIIYKSCDTPPRSAEISNFFTEKQKLLLHLEIRIKVAF